MPDAFEKFSALHFLVLAASAALVAGLVLAGRAARRSERRERALRRAWVISVILVQGFTQVWVNLPGRLDVRSSLPLHICDLTPWVGIAALCTARRWPRALAWFWGIGLSGWAFILPVVTHGPAHLEFWLFWLGHLQIIGTAVYLVAVLGDRPTWGGFRIAAFATAIYSVVIIPIDNLLDADYGYLGRSSAAEILGPWPARTVLLLACEVAMFALIVLPWRWGREEGRSVSVRDTAIPADSRSDGARH